MRSHKIHFESFDHRTCEGGIAHVTIRSRGRGRVYFYLVRDGSDDIVIARSLTRYTRRAVGRAYVAWLEGGIPAGEVCGLSEKDVLVF